MKRLIKGNGVFSARYWNISNGTVRRGGTTPYSSFAKERGANIQPVFDALKDMRYIEVREDKDQIVRITASGLKRLEKQDY
jgi:hypothetical protein